MSWPLLLIFCSILLLLFITHEESFARESLCSIGVCFYAESSKFWNSLLYDLAAGGIITIVFYWILVRWPEFQRRQRIKNSLLSQYRHFKLACIENFLISADGSFNSKFPEQLLDVKNFRKYFTEEVGDNKNRWHEVANNMSDFYMGTTLSHMEIFRQEIYLATQSIDFDDDKPQNLLKDFSHSITMQRNAKNEYEDMKSFLGLFWRFFAGWDWANGYQETDLVEDVIKSI